MYEYKRDKELKDPTVKNLLQDKELKDPTVEELNEILKELKDSIV